MHIVAAMVDEALAAELALVGCLASVHGQMTLQRAFLRKILVAVATSKRADTIVHAYVDLQSMLLFIGLSALFAHVRSQTRVRALVSAQGGG